MSVRIQLDNSPAFYTNLDTISGRIILNLTSDENVTAIVVKLEGESKTALARPPGAQQNLNPSLMNQRDQRQGASVEIHKLLYKTSQVFPSQTPAGVSGSSKAPAYTIRAGEHSYAFQFKIPFNNACSEAHFQNPGSGYGGLQQWQYRHVKKTLPPSLTGFPGKAEIRYFVKVTVQRPGIFRENRRATCGFRFLPIEPPRAPPTTNVVYARRSYSFQPSSSVVLRGEVDVQLPSPPVLTCNEPIPLRIVLRKLSESQEQVYLTSLQMFLIGSTEVSAGDEVEVETSIWTVMSSNGLVLPIGRPSDPLHSETVIDKTLWDQIPLPSSIAPSFHTCNLKRKYSLEVRVGLGYGSQGNIQHQTILPLHFQVHIFSGIAPPAALLNAMTSQPTEDMPMHASTSPYPPQLGNLTARTDAPPSYEDALADELEPSEDRTHRRDYSGVTDVRAPQLEEEKKHSEGPGDVRREATPPPVYGLGETLGSAGDERNDDA